MTTGGYRGAGPLSPRGESSGLQAREPTRRPETPAERHARRKAWGAHFGPLMRSVIAPQIAAYDRQHRKG